MDAKFNECIDDATNTWDIQSYQDSADTGSQLDIVHPSSVDVVLNANGNETRHRRTQAYVESSVKVLPILKGEQTGANKDSSMQTTSSTDCFVINWLIWI